MGIWDLFRQADSNRGIAQFQQTPGGILLDVRTAEEYREGHIPGSKNLPLQSLDKVDAAVENKEVPLFVYCYSGARSRQAVNLLRHMGYSNVTNIGGIAAYRGKVEK